VFIRVTIEVTFDCWQGLGAASGTDRHTGKETERQINS